MTKAQLIATAKTLGVSADLLVGKTNIQIKALIKSYKASPPPAKKAPSDMATQASMASGSGSGSSGTTRATSESGTEMPPIQKGLSFQRLIKMNEGKGHKELVDVMANLQLAMLSTFQQWYDLQEK